MKPLAKFALVALTAASGMAFSQVSELEDVIISETCDAVGEAAGDFMFNRQMGVTIQEQLEWIDQFVNVPYRDLSSYMAWAAYQVPEKELSEDVEVAIRDFSEAWRTSCEGRMAQIIIGE